MSNHKIWILGINPEDPNQLILSVKEKITNNLNVKPGDKVTWEIKKKSGVASITITKNESSTNVFSKGPKEIKGSSSWKGTVDPDIKAPTNELYTIHFTPKDSKEIRRYDPKISVNN